MPATRGRTILKNHSFTMRDAHSTSVCQPLCRLSPNEKCAPPPCASAASHLAGAKITPVSSLLCDDDDAHLERARSRNASCITVRTLQSSPTSLTIKLWIYGFFYVPYSLFYNYIKGVAGKYRSIL